MEGVVQLINRLQGVATLVGDNAASDKTLPGLWELLPSIVVIGGQVRELYLFSKSNSNWQSFRTCKADLLLPLWWSWCYKDFVIIIVDVDRFLLVDDRLSCTRLYAIQQVG